jgi:antitoxin Phd
MADDTWGQAEARAELSEVVRRARSEGPQHVSRNGKPIAVVVSAEEWSRHAERPMPKADARP